MEKFVTHEGLKSFEDVVAEVLKKSPATKPKQEPAQLVAARKLAPGEQGVDTVELDLSKYEVQKLSAISCFNADPVTVPTGPVGPTGFPYAPPGANGPAGPFLPTGSSHGTFSLPLPAPEPGERAEVELRTALRRCLKEGVPLDRLVEIFRLELVDVVHDD